MDAAVPPEDWAGKSSPAGIELMVVGVADSAAVATVATVATAAATLLLLTAASGSE